jgi:DNA invertase Pin-like site-specific DNA recombinase
MKPVATATAFSYMRFSTPEQANGDSIRRQTEARDQWLAAHADVILDTTFNMVDAGRSAFKRTAESFATYALGKFVERVKAGKVPAGSYLLLENLDRLSRSGSARRQSATPRARRAK